MPEPEIKVTPTYVHLLNELEDAIKIEMGEDETMKSLIFDFPGVKILFNHMIQEIGNLRKELEETKKIVRRVDPFGFSFWDRF